MTMDFDSVSRALHLSAAHELWRPGFDASADFAQLPEPEHLQNRELWNKISSRSGLADDISELLWHAMTECLATPALRRLLAHARHCFFEQLTPEDPTPWPMLPAECGQTGRLFYALVFMAEIPRTLMMHQKREIPSGVTAQTLSDMELWIRHFQTQTGQWGFNEYGWIIKHLRGTLFALGRLQFEICANPLPCHLWLHELSGKTIIMVEQGYDFRGDGQFSSADGGVIAGHFYPSSYTETNTEITGFCINPRGCIEHELTTVPREHLRKILWPGAQSLSVHIPATGPLDPLKCAQSFQQSQTFFRRYFPETVINGYWIESWLMDPQLADYLPEQSNICQFQKFFHMVPFPHTNDLQTRQRVFGNDQFKSVDELPQKTELQKIIVAHIRHGKTWRSMGGLKIMPPPNLLG